MRLRVIGLGSPHGDDAVGLEVVRRLAAEALPAGASVVACDRPGLDLLEALEGADAAVLVDAVRSGASPGTVCELGPEGLSRGRTTSSHALGVAHALALSATLGRLPRRLRVVAIELDAADGDGLSPAVRAALPSACVFVRCALAELARELPDSEGGARA
jgi:hydrogenase maturation protease